MLKKIISKALVALMLIGAAAGCTPNSTPSSQAASSAASVAGSSPVTSPAHESTQSASSISLVFWHSMGGQGGEAIDKMVADFNALDNGIEVVAQFQGAYDDAVTKLQSVSGTEAAPDIMQLYDIGTRWMIDSGNAVPMQDYIEKDGWDISQIEPNIAGYYSVDGRLNSMPFNSSTPIMYYNKDAFAAAGLDSNAPPENWDELAAASAKLTRTENGEMLYGFTLRVYGWFFEQYMSKQGLRYADNGNGREALAQSVEFDKNGGGVNLLTKWNALYEQGLLGNMGRDDAAITNAFGAEKTFIIFGSTASLSSITQAVGGSFEIGTGKLPDLDAGVNGGVSIGGGSLWMMNKGNDENKMATWEFIKYMVEPEVQVYWHKQTGYFPISIKAYELAEMHEHLAANPQFQTAIDQLHASPVDARGALLGVFTEARQTVEQNIETMLAGDMTPEAAVAEMAKSINSSIEKYNIANS